MAEKSKAYTGWVTRPKDPKAEPGGDQGSLTPEPVVPAKATSWGCCPRPRSCSPCGGERLQAPLGTGPDHVPKGSPHLGSKQTWCVPTAAWPRTRPAVPGPFAACLPAEYRAGSKAGKGSTDGRVTEPRSSHLLPNRVPAVQPHRAVTKRKKLHHAEPLVLGSDIR